MWARPIRRTETGRTVDIFIGLVAGAAVAAIIVYLVQEIRRRQEVAHLQGQLETSKSTEELLQTAEQRLGTAFQAAAAPVMRANSEQFLTLAEQNLGKQLESAKSEFQKRQQSFDALVKPLSENYGKLNPTIESLMAQNRAMTEETTRLRDALSDNRQVGVWGEIQLRRIIELANMVEYCDFSEQTTVDDGSGRPDVTVRLPESRTIIIDSKASTAAYMEAQEAEDESTAADALNRHAGALRSKVDDLARKDYGAKVAGSLPFVVMFVPGDQFLAAALQARNDLIEYAISKRVAIATPSSLISLLWAVANGWQQHHLAENAERIREAGEAMHTRLQTFMGHYKRAGDQLRRAVESFNASIGSFDRNVIPQGRRFAELRGRNPDEYDLPSYIDSEVRESAYGVGEDTTTEDKNETP